MPTNVYTAVYKQEIHLNWYKMWIFHLLGENKAKREHKAMSNSLKKKKA